MSFVSVTSWLPLIAGTVAVLALIFSKKKERFAFTAAFLNEWRGPTVYPAARWVRDEFCKKLTPELVAGGYRGLHKDDLERVRTVSFFFDYVGGAMLTGLLDKRLILSAIGSPAIECWRILGPLIEAQRQLSASEAPSAPYRRYQMGFEHLVAEALKFRASNILKGARVTTEMLEEGFRPSLRQRLGFDRVL